MVFVIADVAIDSGDVVDDGLYILLQLLILLFFKFCFLILSFLFDKTKLKKLNRRNDLVRKINLSFNFFK